MYAEVGADSSDTASVTFNYGSGGVSTAKSFNILVRQIACTDTWK